MVEEIGPEAATKKKGCVFWILVAVGVFVALAIIGSLLPEPTPEQKAEMAAKEQAAKTEEAAKQLEEANAKRDNAVKTTAGELFSAYQGNEMAAQQQFGGKTLEVSGTVDGVDLDFSDDPVVKLRTSNQFMAVSVYLTEETQNAAASYQKGQKITVLCEGISEIASMPQLKDCIPVD